jgi:hypothetical protein
MEFREALGLRIKRSIPISNPSTPYACVGIYLRPVQPFEPTSSFDSVRLRVDLISDHQRTATWLPPNSSIIEKRESPPHFTGYKATTIETANTLELLEHHRTSAVPRSHTTFLEVGVLFDLRFRRWPYMFQSFSPFPTPTPNWTSQRAVGCVHSGVGFIYHLRRILDRVAAATAFMAAKTASDMLSDADLYPGDSAPWNPRKT